MRRKYFGWAIAAVALLGPQAASAGDREIAGQIIERLKVNRSAGQLKDFKFDMKVNDGVVKFSGSVTEDRQRDLVLAAAEGIEGVNRVVDQIAVTGGQARANVGASAPIAAAAKPMVDVAAGFDMAGALATAAAEIVAESGEPSTVYHEAGAVKPVANFESHDDQTMVQNALKALGSAQKSGQLSGFGVDVQCQDGVIELSGRAQSANQRDQILAIVRDSSGASSIRQNIEIVGQPQVNAVSRGSMIDPPVQTASARPMPMQAQQVAAPMHQQQMAQSAQFRMNQQGFQAQPAAHNGVIVGAPVGGVSGTPVPIAPYAAAGAPRYDTPNLPNYAWPGYAAHPNYAAVTYPQQYSPSAWPYIGPFYPYPQVPLGWRKVSLEWDDGWWFLDFTDRDY